MKIVALETILSADFPNLLWVQIHTDSGLTGVGETFYWPQAVAAYLHEAVAPYLLSSDPLAIEQHSRVLLQGFLASGSAGVETRGHSAVDIALWDIFGQSAGLPASAPACAPRSCSARPPNAAAARCRTAKRRPPRRDVSDVSR
jgi:L-alanine-DL-glutamate epimerase-like enolase superfamily enzyme